MTGPEVPSDEDGGGIDEIEQCYGGNKEAEIAVQEEDDDVDGRGEGFVGHHDNGGEGVALEAVEDGEKGVEGESEGGRKADDENAHAQKGKELCRGLAEDGAGKGVGTEDEQDAKNGTYDEHEKGIGENAAGGAEILGGMMLGDVLANSGLESEI